MGTSPLKAAFSFGSTSCATSAMRHRPAWSWTGGLSLGPASGAVPVKVLIIVDCAGILEIFLRSGAVVAVRDVLCGMFR